MFRKMRRFKQQLSEEECIEILKKEPRGVLSVHGEDGYPYGLPINFVYDNGKLYFHCAKEGHKIDALRKDNRASFAIYDEGYLIEGKLGLNIKSVILFGHIHFIDDPELSREETRKLGLKYLPPEQVEKELAAPVQPLILELEIDHMTGKLVNES
ncbi:MAG: pyridoxamine 5'-phosphate oxidase family protein [Anaerovoracaceae bacterium]|jgi:nitroimidazol reductase NimA-like FMN-containing flavoprotein (pyridoxamine 5'-phosphate oxidase superfamily)